MPPRALADLVLLAALWGGSFLFMRIAAPEFGPIALIALRVAIAAAFLLAVLAARGGLASLRAHAVALLVVGGVNSALPFCLFAWATLSVTAGFAAILNATSPMWGALVAWAWLGERPGPARIAGLAVGFAGIVVLSGGTHAFRDAGAGLAVLAGLAGALSYGVGASYTRRRLAGVDPWVVATGSQLGATLLLAPLAAPAWPAVPPSAAAWASTVAMGVASTGLAYILYFRLIATVGPARAITVTYLVPVFAVAWGAVLLGEGVTSRMLAGGAIVLLGTALSTGALSPRPSGSARA